MRETGPSWRWIAVSSLPVCGAVMAYIFVSGATASAEALTEMSKKVQNQGERLAALETQKEADKEWREYVKQSLDRIWDKINK